LKWLKEAKGFSEMTIRTIENALWRYEDFTNHEDYGLFSQHRAIGVKKWLQARHCRDKPVSITTVYHHLRHLKDFFLWLAGQSGYKSKISLDIISYLSLEKKKVREAISPRQLKFPSLEYVLSLTRSIKIENEIDQRDRALIAFLLLSGMRDKAICTLPLGCFDRKSLEINQDSKLGVETKFGRTYVSILFRFDEELVKHVIEWAEYLERIKLFSTIAPLFPRSNLEQTEGGFCFISKEVEPVFWKGTGAVREILKNRAKEAGLDYYHPHSFRHAAVHLAMKCGRTAEEIKAISQNFGHENIGTTMMTYGTLDQFSVTEIVTGIDFSNRPEKTNRDGVIEELKKQLDRLKNRELDKKWLG